MKRISIIFPIVVLAAFLLSCESFMIKGNGNVVEETRDPGAFDKLSVTRGMNVYIVQGSPLKVVVKADENLLKIIETEVHDGTLEVSCNRGIINATSNKVIITVPDINSIKTTAGSNVFAEDTLQLKSIEIKSTAGSNVRLKLTAESLKLKTSAGANIYLSGISKIVNLEASSGANVKARDLISENCTIEASSGANIWIEVQKELKASASSGGNIHYSGDPSVTDINKSSGGNVNKK